MLPLLCRSYSCMQARKLAPQLLLNACINTFREQHNSIGEQSERSVLQMNMGLHTVRAASSASALARWPAALALFTASLLANSSASAAASLASMEECLRDTKWRSRGDVDADR